jgi:fumarate reductase subunit D
MLLASKEERVKKENDVIFRRPLPPYSIRILEYAIMFLVIYQTLHMIDHLLQYYESYVLNIPAPPGLFEGLFNASSPKVHLWLNSIEYVTILIIGISFLGKVRPIEKLKSELQQQRRKPYSLRILECVIIFLVIYQTLHVIDHAVQYYQRYILNIPDAPALFKGLFNESNTIIHAWINGILIISTFTIWIAFRKSKQRYLHYLSSRQE